MSPDVATLLAGPRGRRLCLEYAMAADAEVRTATFVLASRSGGASSFLLLSAEDGAPGRELPDATPERLAALIDGLQDDAARRRDVRAALAASVDSARYWQEPDEWDVIAAEPAVRSALAGVAERVLASPEAATWTSGPGPAQWAVDWRADTDRPLPRDAEAILAEWSAARRADEERSARERPNDPSASWSGTWWSLPLRLPRTQSRIDDLLELVEDSAGLDAATVIPVTPTASPAEGAGRTLEIASADDWARLCRVHPAEVTASRRHDWYRVTGGEGRWLIPDWQRVAADWDAVHLTTLGYLSAATRPIPIDEDHASVLAGWAPDSTLRLSDGARESDAPRQQWRRPPGERRWRRTA